MYVLIVVLLMLVLPVGSIWAEHTYVHSTLPLLWLIGKWFVFWSAGVRLGLAGLRQFFQPKFTAEEIFQIKEDAVLPLVRELGVANFAIGTVGILSLAKPSFVLPVAIYAALFYGIAGIRHVAEHDRSRNENVAMVSDLLVSLVFAFFVAYAVVTGFSG